MFFSIPRFFSYLIPGSFFSLVLPEKPERSYTVLFLTVESIRFPVQLE
jgi:hypothetical protein